MKNPKANKEIKKYILPVLVSLVQILALYAIIRKGMPKLTAVIFVIPVVFYNIRLAGYIKDNLPAFASPAKRRIYFALTALTAFVFYKSVNLETVFVHEGAMSVPFVLGMAAFYFQLVLMVTMLLEKAALQSKTEGKRRFNPLYALPTLLVSAFLYLVYFPGLCSPDSAYVWTAVAQNIYSDAHPVIYMLLIKGLRLLWDDIAVVILFQIVLASGVYAFVISELGKMGAPRWLCWAAAVVMALLPVNALYTVTFWKDVPYSLGLLTLSVLLLKCLTGDYYSKKKALPQMFFAALFTLFMRHNALFSVFLPLLILGIYYIAKKNKKLIVKTLILGAGLIVAYFGIKAAVFAAMASEKTGAEYLGDTFVNLSQSTTIATQQVIYTEHVAGTSFTAGEKELFDKFFNREAISEHKEKFADGIWMFYHKPLVTVNGEALAADKGGFWRYYFGLWMKFPGSMLDGYERITSINWASSGYGPVSYRGTAGFQMEGFEGCEFRPVIKGGMHYTLDRLFFTYKDSSVAAFLWRPASAFILMLLCLHAAVRKRGAGALFLVLPAAFNQLTYFIVIASQDARYTYINFTVFLLVLVLALLKRKDPAHEKARQGLPDAAA